jgi:ankyrin repeat protein
MKRAETYEEIAPLVELCKAGKLFEVQDWIKAGKPVNPPPHVSGHRKKGPLEIAIEKGFHSLVQVLLEGGAEIDEGLRLIEKAIDKNRLDLVELLVEHGADIHSVDMVDVFGSYQRPIMVWFVERGADIETDQPLAYALCNRVKPALGIVKKYGDSIPYIQEQVNTALRYHCREGNMRWVGLMLWAGGDPYAKGADEWGKSSCVEYEKNALELAACWGSFEVFKLKRIRLDPGMPELSELLFYACQAHKSELLEMLIEKGFDPAAHEKQGTALIQELLTSLVSSALFHSSRDFWELDSRSPRKLDNSGSREKMKMIHLLAKQGAKWLPEGRKKIGEARRSLLKMRADYTVEFVWIMAEYGASRREDLEELVRTSSMKSLMAKHKVKVSQLMGQKTNILA